MFIGVSLAMDAFAISVLYGLTYNDLKIYQQIFIAGYFGFFQAILPILGYGLGLSLANFIGKIDHYLAFVLLVLMGINMIHDACGNEELPTKMNIISLTLLAIATSVDAFAVGITFAFFEVNIIQAVMIIGFITIFLCFIAIRVGKILSKRFKNKAIFLGGVILIFLAIKILFQHLLK